MVLLKCKDGSSSKNSINEANCHVNALKTPSVSWPSRGELTELKPFLRNVKPGCCA